MHMAYKKIAKNIAAVFAAGATGILIALVSIAFGSTSVRADQHRDDLNRDLAAIGLRIAPDFINTNGKDLTLVGVGSFIVNAQADCNGCHGSDPANEFLPKNNPYFRPPNNAPVKFNQATYLNGGQDFGPVGPGISHGVVGAGPDIISRNLTPDYTGNPEGGNDLHTFMTIIRTGHDYDHLHPNCGEDVTDNCYFAPVNGDVLQVMPWPNYEHMTDYQLKAIWTYLSTVPCNAHNDALGTTYPWLKNRCE
jgi:hypothetical protein